MLPATVNHYLCPQGMHCGTFLDRVREQGFAGVGLTAAALEEFPAARMRAELKARGLRASSVNTAGFFLHQEGARDQARANAWLLESAAELKVVLNVIVGGSANMPLTQARRKAAAGLAELARDAASVGVQLIVEPLHPLNVRGKSCFNTIAQVEAVFADIPGLALNADLFHLWWDPDLDRLLRGGSVPVGLLQICDVAMPDQAQPIPRRVPLGEGFVAWQDCVSAAAESFPLAAVELELFADQLPGRELEEVLRKSAASLTAYFGEKHADGDNR